MKVGCSVDCQKVEEAIVEPASILFSSETRGDDNFEDVCSVDFLLRSFLHNRPQCMASHDLQCVSVCVASVEFHR